jgi:hypothetical protein
MHLLKKLMHDTIPSNIQANKHESGAQPDPTHCPDGDILADIDLLCPRTLNIQQICALSLSI